ncbi:MAG: Uma2 family endonuclease [Tunicatimonas sp.]
MEQQQISHKLTLAEYNQLEEETQQCYEYHDGEVFAMAGGDPVHNAIGGNVITVLNQLLRNKNCNVFTSDQKVYIDFANKYLYPDASVTCGPVERAEKDTKAIVNPILLVEVLSISTEAYDRGRKFEYFSRLPSLREYVLLSQHEPKAQLHYRSSPTEPWQVTWVSELDQTLRLPSLEIETTLDELYLKTEGL